MTDPNSPAAQILLRLNANLDRAKAAKDGATWRASLSHFASEFSTEQRRSGCTLEIHYATLAEILFMVRNIAQRLASTEGEHYALVLCSKVIREMVKVGCGLNCEREIRDALDVEMPE